MIDTERPMKYEDFNDIDSESKNQSSRRMDNSLTQSRQNAVVKARADKVHNQMFLTMMEPLWYQYDDKNKGHINEESFVEISL